MLPSKGADAVVKYSHCRMADVLPLRSSFLKALSHGWFQNHSRGVVNRLLFFLRGTKSYFPMDIKFLALARKAVISDVLARLLTRSPPSTLYYTREFLFVNKNAVI